VDNPKLSYFEKTFPAKPINTATENVQLFNTEVVYFDYLQVYIQQPIATQNYRTQE
jgi:hypothetical protein